MAHLRSGAEGHHAPHHHQHARLGPAWLRWLPTGHHHDSADRVDAVMENDVTAQRALVLSFAMLAATAAIQGVVVATSGSVALLGDTLHNAADALTAVPLLIAFRLARRPANSRFTYGYGRAEDVAGLFVVLVIACSAVFAGVAAVERLVHPAAIDHLWAVAGAGAVGFAGNEAVARYRTRVGRRLGSAALVADGLHARTDGWASLAVLLSAGGAGLGWRWADPVVGIAITVAIASVLRTAIRQVGARLLDAVDPHLLDEAVDALRSVDGLRAVRDLRLRWIGHTLRAEANIDVDPTISLRQAHEIAHHAEAHLLAFVPRLTGATVHASPAGAHPSVVGSPVAR